jgi:hypothetical protein
VHANMLILNAEFWKQVPPSEPYRVILSDVRDKLYNTRERSRHLLTSGFSEIPDEAIFTDVEQVFKTEVWVILICQAKYMYFISSYTFNTLNILEVKLFQVYHSCFIYLISVGIFFFCSSWSLLSSVTDPSVHVVITLLQMAVSLISYGKCQHLDYPLLG